jgi:signal transduction histidine kinase
LFFLVAIAIVMAFLIYSEYVINELRDSQRDRAELYAHLTTLVQSTTLPPQLEEWVIRHVVIHKEEIFPIVMTDHRGAIGDWGGPGLPDPGDRSAAALKAVRDIIGRMDAEREPIRFSGEQALGLVWLADGDMVISSHEKDIVIWEGPSLPPRADTTAAAVDMVFQRLQTMGRPDSIQVPAKAGGDFYWEGSNFVIADEAGRPLDWGGPVFSESSGFAEALLEMQRMATVSEPRNFRIETEKILHYGDSDLISRIEFAPFVTLGALFLFSLIGFVGFRNIRRSEQRSIWVGMAKETAHQLGTPLSSLSGWLELMATKYPTDGATQSEAKAIEIASIAREMQQDLGRLNQIASRFSQIGSVPELQEGDVKSLLGETISYFQKRGPQFGEHRIDFRATEVANIPLNTELMGWAFENLFKNALDAIGRKDGLIVVELRESADDETLKITITDNGRGIRPEHQSRIFEPGFSTKKRGWGLGLAFVKRIVEDYHGGRIQVVESAEDNGASFEIVLPMHAR